MLRGLALPTLASSGRARYSWGVASSATPGGGPTPLARRVEEALAARRRALVAHPLYAAVNSVERLRGFMGDHVFAVWDFMCLLKRLQRELTCVDVLWRPPADPVLARFVNEVVLVEESDAVLGGAMSHLELYRRAMGEVDADGRAFDAFLAALERRVDPSAGRSQRRTRRRTSGASSRGRSRSRSAGRSSRSWPASSSAARR